MSLLTAKCLGYRIIFWRAFSKEHKNLCTHFWSEKCPCKTGKKIKYRDCSSQSWKKLDTAVLKKHLEGKAADASDVIGISPLLPDDTCRFLFFDFDNHEKDTDKEETRDAHVFMRRFKKYTGMTPGQYREERMG